MRGRQTLTALETAWKRDPQAVFVRLGEAIRDGGAPDRATSVLRDGLVRWPHQLAGWVALARTLLTTGHADEAEAALAEALSRDPEHWGANLVQAELFRSKGAIAEEVAVLRRLAHVAPGQEGVARRLRIAEAAVAHRPALPGSEPFDDDGTTRPLPTAHVLRRSPASPFRVRTTPSAVRPVAPERQSTVPAAVRPLPPRPGAPRRAAPLSGPGGKHRKPAPADPFLNETMADLLAAQGLSAEAHRMLDVLAERGVASAGLAARVASWPQGSTAPSGPLEPDSALSELLLAVATDLDALGSATAPQARKDRS